MTKKDNNAPKQHFILAPLTPEDAIRHHIDPATLYWSTHRDGTKHSYLRFNLDDGFHEEVTKPQWKSDRAFRRHCSDRFFDSDGKAIDYTDESQDAYRTLRLEAFIEKLYQLTAEFDDLTIAIFCNIYYGEGRREVEIAEQFHVRQGTVSKKKKKLLEYLRDKLADFQDLKK